MKTKNLLNSTLAILALSMFFATGSLYARNGGAEMTGGRDEGMREEGGPGPGYAMHEGRGPKEGPDFEKLYKDLNVTEAQQVKLKDEREEHRKQMQELQIKLRDQRQALAEELDKQNSDKAKLDKITAEMKKLMSEMVDQRLNSALKIKEILTPEQYQKFTEDRKSHFKKMRKEMKRNEKRPAKKGAGK